MQAKEIIPMIVGSLSIIGTIIAGAIAFETVRGDFRVLVQDVGHLESKVIAIQAEAINRDQQHSKKKSHDGMIDELAEVKGDVKLQTYKVDKALDGIEEIKALIQAQDRRARDAR